MKILHTADIHLGAKLQKLRQKADEQRIQIQKTFERTVDLAIESKADIFVIAGDMFDTSDPEKYLVDFVLSNFARLEEKHIYTFVGLGTHDFFSKSTVFDVLRGSGFRYITVFDNPENNSSVIEDISTIVFCNTPVSNRTSESPLTGIKRNGAYKYNIAIAHGSVQIPGKSSLNDSPITFEEIAASGMDYIALGHWHNQQDVSRGNVTAWYSGAPEMIDLDQSNSGKVLFITLQENEMPVVESVQTGKRIFDSLQIDIGTCANLEVLINKIKNVTDRDLIRKVDVTGVLPVDFGILDIDEIYRRLDENFFYLIMKDKTTVSIKDIESAYTNSLLKTKFMEYIKKNSQDERMTEAALQLGLLLLDGKTKVY